MFLATKALNKQIKKTSTKRSRVTYTKSVSALSTSTNKNSQPTTLKQATTNKLSIYSNTENKNKIHKQFINELKKNQLMYNRYSTGRFGSPSDTRFPRDLSQQRIDPSIANTTNKFFVYLPVAGVGVSTAIMAKFVASGFINYMAPTNSVLARANFEVDIGEVEPGTSISVTWRGKPIFIRNRTQDEIDRAHKEDNDNMRDHELDSDRHPNPTWVIVEAICSHLGCIPVVNTGNYNGWFCPCHGSHYDNSGRIRAGPAPLNLKVPPYKFLTDTRILLGVKG